LTPRDNVRFVSTQGSQNVSGKGHDVVMCDCQRTCDKNMSVSDRRWRNISGAREKRTTSSELDVTALYGKEHDSKGQKTTTCQKRTEHEERRHQCAEQKLKARDNYFMTTVSILYFQAGNSMLRNDSYLSLRQCLEILLGQRCIESTEISMLQ